jgi:hypothetical protein
MQVSPHTAQALLLHPDITVVPCYNPNSIQFNESYDLRVRNMFDVHLHYHDEVK